MKNQNSYIGPAELPTIDCKVILFNEYKNDFEDPNEFIIATCINYDNNKPFKIRFRKEDLKWMID